MAVGGLAMARGAATAALLGAALLVQLLATCQGLTLDGIKLRPPSMRIHDFTPLEQKVGLGPKIVWDDETECGEKTGVRAPDSQFARSFALISLAA